MCARSRALLSTARYSRAAVPSGARPAPSLWLSVNIFGMRFRSSASSLALVPVGRPAPPALASSESALVAAEKREAAPKLSLRDLEGQKRQLSQLKGRSWS